MCYYGPYDNECNCGREHHFKFICGKSEQLQNTCRKKGWNSKYKRVKFKIIQTSVVDLT